MYKFAATFRADFQRYYFYSSGHPLLRMLRCWCAPGLQAIAVMRFGQWSRKRILPLRLVCDPLYLVLQALVKIVWGIEVPRGTQIGRGFYIGHFGGINISSTAVLGKNCNISQGITIGVSGYGDKKGVPIIGDNVYIAPGARLFGKISIGHNAKIGANTVIHDDIPDNAVVVLDPGYRILSFKGNINPNQVE
ncbi:MAG: serine acetyltransferase [Pseudomonadota bacterium]